MPDWIEKDRLAALERYQMMDTPREREFDDIVKLAAQICGTPIAIITLLSKERQWFKAAVGTEETETPRNIAFCNHAIMHSGVFEVTDTRENPDFAGNPLVTGEPHLRFYTSAPLETADGFPLGTLCVLDTKPGKLTEEQKFALRTLANQVIGQLELRRIAREQNTLRQTYENILTTTPDLVYTFGLDKRFQYANKALLDMWGITAEAASGKSLRELNYPEWHAAMHEREIDQVLATGKPIRGEVHFPHDTLGVRTYDYIFAPIFAEDNSISGIAGSTRDVTDRKNMEEALRKSEERRAVALHASDFIGTWDWDIKNDLVTADERFAKIFSVDIEKASQGTNISEFTTAIHPDDVAEVAERIEFAKKTGGSFSAEYRLMQPEGTFRWVHATGRVHVDENNNPVRFPGVVIDITQRKMATDAAEEARRLAEEANAAKTEFLTNMSHEIRTPMNAVIGLSTILAMSSPLTAKQREYIETLKLSADSLLGLINDLLDISKIEARSIELENIAFSPKVLASDVMSMISLKAREKSLTFTLQNNVSEHVRFMGDPARLKQMLINLCSNAVKFTDAGEVVLAIDAKGTTDTGIGGLIFKVRDTGIGIASENHQTVFEKFAQADSSISRKYGGTGLGLTITKTLVEKMGGTITLESTLGEGSCFTMEIPLAVANSVLPEEKAKTPENVVLASTSHRVLLVDDQPANIIVASAFLERFGYAYEIALNGPDAVNLANNNPFSLILMDVQMDGMSGYEATALIRRHERDHDMPPARIIGMTAHALSGDREKCLAAGMNDYIAKPFKPEELQQALAV